MTLPNTILTNPHGTQHFLGHFQVNMARKVEIHTTASLEGVGIPATSPVKGHPARTAGEPAKDRARELGGQRMKDLTCKSWGWGQSTVPPLTEVINFG